MKEILAAIIIIFIIGYCGHELMQQIDVAAEKVVGRNSQIAKVVGE